MIKANYLKISSIQKGGRSERPKSRKRKSPSEESSSLSISIDNESISSESGPSCEKAAKVQPSPSISSMISISSDTEGSVTVSAVSSKEVTQGEQPRASVSPLLVKRQNRLNSADQLSEVENQAPIKMTDELKVAFSR